MSDAALKGMDRKNQFSPNHATVITAANKISAAARQMNTAAGLNGAAPVGAWPHHTTRHGHGEAA
ncbi:hypothetical protein [Aureimonas psammosilenae]|uniref:hypothetical protein n=1 Tax=Aureimonas psammosilenae TaxID=2495496 RepID=UPI001260D5F0|nr:hypothetical protein [Aureimonas psammosilenae]